MPHDSTASAAPLGTLFIFGGGDDEPMLARLARMLPRRTDPIEILTTATRRQPARTAGAYAHSFHQQRCPHVRHLQVDEDHPADDPATLDRLREARLLFISGGDQERLTDFLLGTEFLQILKEKHQHEADFILAGTSAGASVMAESMLVEGVGWRGLLAGRVLCLPGFGLLPGVVLDQHFIERHRYPRLFHAVLQQPHLLGIGLSEETGLIIRPGQPAEVFGDEAIVVVDGGQLTHIGLANLPKDEMISGHGFRLHLLTDGQGLDLTTRQPVVANG
ncbi:cyanophycinase [Hymenobacter sp. ASUV-10]|uniref:Cyanophycinase n=1 Tax=Hymenobacter aranciens TaxID=3063996 RepID=A0ABT9B6Q9_9BACT|nr:cyanophycinase [Hymenobacter sp. ASUV-10]MDO7873338.1 cyanophycinase [Hymenobacter sp. ASUV-10]